MNELSIAGEIIQKCGISIFNQLLFIPERILLPDGTYKDFELPKGFIEYTRKQKAIYFSTVASLRIQPTTTCRWIWFGAYDQKGYPRFNNQSVILSLYQNLITPLVKGARLKGFTNLGKPDVNPYSYRLASKGHSKLVHIQNQMQYTGLPADQVMNDEAREEFIASVGECMKEMNEANEMITEKDMMRSYLLSEGFADMVINSAFEKTNIIFKDITL